MWMTLRTSNTSQKTCPDSFWAYLIETVKDTLVCITLNVSWCVCGCVWHLDRYLGLFFQETCNEKFKLPVGMRLLCCCQFVLFVVCVVYFANAFDRHSSSPLVSIKPFLEVVQDHFQHYFLFWLLLKSVSQVKALIHQRIHISLHKRNHHRPSFAAFQTQKRQKNWDRWRKGLLFRSSTCSAKRDSSFNGCPGPYELH